LLVWLLNEMLEQAGESANGPLVDARSVFGIVVVDTAKLDWNKTDESGKTLMTETEKTEGQTLDCGSERDVATGSVGVGY